MAYQNIPDLVIENARIFHKNFEGHATDFNREGNRTFSVAVNAEEVDALTQAGWRIRCLPPREGVEGSEPLYFIDVRVNYDSKRPPQIYLVTSKNTVLLDEKTVGTIDHADIKNVDLMLHPSFWEAAGKSGVKAYLKSMYVTIVDDVLAEKYGTGFYSSPVYEEPGNSPFPQG